MLTLHSYLPHLLNSDIQHDKSISLELINIIRQQIQMEQEHQPKRPSTYPLFSRHFTTHPQDAVIFFREMQGQMQDYVEAFRRRIEVEVEYSKNLMEVSQCLDKHIKPGTDISTSFICSAFKVEHERRSRQSYELAESLRTEIEEICAEYLKNQTASLRKIEKEVKKYYQDAENFTENHKRTLEGFQNITKKTEEATISKNIVKFTTGLLQDKKGKIIGKLAQQTNLSKQSEKAYLNSIKDYNSFTAVYNQEITGHLDETQRVVREQVILQGDCLRKLIIAEISMFKNIQYDLLNICKQMEVLDTQKNVENFNEEQKNNTNHKIIPIEKREEESKKTATPDPNVFPLEEKKAIGKTMLGESIYYVEEGYFEWMMTNKKNKKLRQLIHKAWKMLKNDLNSCKTAKIERTEVQKQEKDTEQMANHRKEETAQQKEWQEQLKEAISTFKIIHPPNIQPSIKQKTPKHDKIYTTFIEIIRIIAFLWNIQDIDLPTLNSKLASLQGYLQKHHLYRLIAYMFIEEYRLQHDLVIRSSKNARICGKIFRVIIKQSQKKNDVFIINGILGLVFTFYWNEEKTKKLMNLVPQIYQCQIWKKSDFWEAAIYQTTYEEMSLFSMKKGETAAEVILREKNMIFNHLASYCNYMVMLGVLPKNVRLIVGRYCRLYELTEGQNKELSVMINDTEKQFKQFYRASGKYDKEKSVLGD